MTTELFEIWIYHKDFEAVYTHMHQEIRDAHYYPEQQLYKLTVESGYFAGLNMHELLHTLAVFYIFYHPMYPVFKFYESNPNTGLGRAIEIPHTPINLEEIFKDYLNERSYENAQIYRLRKTLNDPIYVQHHKALWG